MFDHIIHPNIAVPLFRIFHSLKCSFMYGNSKSISSKFNGTVDYFNAFCFPMAVLLNSFQKDPLGTSDIQKNSGIANSSKYQSKFFSAPVLRQSTSGAMKYIQSPVSFPYNFHSRHWIGKY